MKRRDFLASSTAILTAGFAGCLSSFSDSSSEREPVFEGEVIAKALFGIPRPNSPVDTDRFRLLYVNEDSVSGTPITDNTDLTEDDIEMETRLDDLPLGEVYAAFDIQRTFVETDVRLLTRDEVNNIDATEDGVGHSYRTPTEYFDRLQIGERYELQVAQSTEHQAPRGRLRQRIIDVK